MPPAEKPLVAHIVLNLRVGGLERVVVNLVRGLRNSPFRCVVFCLEERGEFADEVEDLGVPVFVLNKPVGRSWRCIWQLAQLLRRQHVTILHTHNASPHFHGLLAARLARVPVRVHTKHGRDYPNDKQKVFQNWFLAWLTDMIVPVSDDAGQVAAEIESVNPSKIRRIWNGIDVDHYRATDNVAARALVIGTVARLSPEKDQRTMLAAFRYALDEIPEVRLILVGDGPSMKELRHTAAALGLNGHVDFLGQRSDIPEMLQRMSLFTLSSKTEGISMTILEAMAAGLPVVATDVGGNREIVNPPECGLIVPPCDPEAFAQAYVKLLHDPQLRTAMGDAARARVLAHFSLQHMVDEYRKLYDALIMQKTGKR